MFKYEALDPDIPKVSCGGLEDMLLSGYFKRCPIRIDAAVRMDMYSFIFLQVKHRPNVVVQDGINLDSAVTRFPQIPRHL